MNAREFFELVRELRKVQKEHYRILSSDSCLRAMEMEKKVDDEIARVEKILSEKK